MRSLGSPPADPRLRDVLLLALGIGGLVACVTLVFLGMRSVMDVGGACAEGGPYVPAQACPEGSTAALLLGIFGGFGFGALALVSGSRVGGLWAGAAILIGWSGLFAALGWNFLEYGWLNPPPGEGIVWGWLIPGVLFEAMALGPILLVAWAGVARGTGAGGAGAPRPVVTGAMDDEAAVASEEADEAPDGTGALVGQLERLADLRARGLLAADEYERAKAAVLHELEQRR